MKRVANSCLLLIALLAPAQAADKPNIVVILADDMGFSDLGCYGGEIETPNLDALAARGLRFTQFYSAARCCPTRASLLTGLYPHQAGIGHMTGDDGIPSYRGYLNDRCVTLAEALKAAGYTALAVGKWHVGSARGRWPLDRGFLRYWGTPAGGGVYFAVARHGEAWELYDLKRDRTERRDLAREQPNRLRELAALWQVWAERCGVRDWAELQKRRQERSRAGKR